jgi:tyrosyl-tRNA synthetase
MQVKMRLARQIVADFHSTEAADQAQCDFDREVRGGQQPADIQTVTLPGGIGNNLAKILVALDLSDSRTDAERKIKAGAVEVNGQKYISLTIALSGETVIRVGKKWKRVQV